MKLLTRIKKNDAKKEERKATTKENDGYSLTPQLSKLKIVHPFPDRPSKHTRTNSTHISEHYSIAACYALITRNQYISTALDRVPILQTGVLRKCR